MMISSQSVSRAVLLISCQMTMAGIEHLLVERNVEVQQFCRLESVCTEGLPWATAKTNMLVISFSMHLADWQQRLQLIRSLRKSLPQMQIVVVLDAEIPYLVQWLLRLCVSGILSQQDSLAEMEEGFTKIYQNGSHYSPRIQSALFYHQQGIPEPVTLRSVELKVLQHLLSGHSVKRTANLLYRSEKTVMAIKTKAMHKLGITHNAGLVVMKEILGTAVPTSDSR